MRITLQIVVQIIPGGNVVNGTGIGKKNIKVEQKEENFILNIKNQINEVVDLFIKEVVWVGSKVENIADIEVLVVRILDVYIKVVVRSIVYLIYGDVSLPILLEADLKRKQVIPPLAVSVFEKNIPDIIAPLIKNFIQEI